MTRRVATCRRHQATPRATSDVQMAKPLDSISVAVGASLDAKLYIGHHGEAAALLRCY